MRSYLHSHNWSIRPAHAHSVSNLHPDPISCKYTAIMPSSGTYVKDSDFEMGNFSDICAAIRHHILDQVTNTGGLHVSTKQNFTKAVCPPSRPHSTPPYGIRGTKRHTDQFAQSAPHEKRPRSSIKMTNSQTSTTQQKPTFSKADYQNMSEDIMTFTATRQQDKSLYISKMKLRDALYDVIKAVFPYLFDFERLSSATIRVGALKPAIKSQ